jgi:RHS repeat-associated protein
MRIFCRREIFLSTIKGRTVSLSRNNNSGRRRTPFIAAATAALTLTGLTTAVTSSLPASAAAATTANPTPAAGSRKNATQLPFSISGTGKLSVDVATGNTLFTDQLLTLPGIGQDIPITLSYNSSVFGTGTPSAVTGGTGSGWGITGFDQRLITNPDVSITYYGPGGLSGVFAPNGSGGYTAPEEFQATLAVLSGTGYTLTDHVSQTKLTFNTSGRLISSTDRNGNITTFAYDPYGNPASITSTRSPVAGRTLTVHTSGGHISSLTQTSSSLSRSIGFGYSAGGHLDSVTDDVNGTTQFTSAPGTDTGQVVTITNPADKTTTLGFTSGKTSSIAQQNPASDGGAGTSTTRLAYPSSTQTLVADPTTNQSQPVASVPNTAYTISTDGLMLVNDTTDPDGNKRSSTYTALGNISTAQGAATDQSTYTYGANNNESLTQIQNPGGATERASYNNSQPAAQYLPSSTTNDASNSLTYTYDGQGNQATTAQGSAPQAVVKYNSDGTPTTSASPGAPQGVVTSYGYTDGNHELNTLTPPSGTSLGNRAYTYDSFGRLATATDGRSDTLTYTYDNADRIKTVRDSNPNTPDVTYTYNALNEVKTRTDGNGTTTYTYDDLDHLLSVTNTAGGGTIAYTYDLAGDESSITTGMGTTTYGYDNAHELTSMVYPQNGNTETTVFHNDADGRRTDAWLQSNADHTVWAAHEQFTYDTSGRIKTVLGQNGPATAPTTVVDETQCYSVNSTAPNCSATATDDRSNVQSVFDSVTGETTSYSYDTSNRLHQVVITGGGNPRTYTYGYDNAGNRTSTTVTGTSPSSQTLSFNNANQITTAGYTYDGSGNLTASPGQTATFNAAGQQTSVKQGNVTTSYTYAGTNQDELLSESTPGGSTYQYAYGRTDSNGLPEIESVTDNGSTGYVLHDSTGQPVMLQTASGVTCLYLYDGIGNPVGLSTSASTTSVALQYDPYGAATRTDSGGNNGGWTENPYLFQGGTQDRVTGQVKFGQRWYNPTVGSWTQQDALNAPLDPSSANRYEYAADNPINNNDHSGLSWTDVICFGGGLGSSWAGLAVGATERAALGADIGLGGIAFAEICGLTTLPSGFWASHQLSFIAQAGGY